MPKYNQYSSTAEYESKKRKTTLHPIWRGVGFIFMVLIPIISYFLSVWLLTLNAANKWISVPPEFISSGADPLLYVKIGLTIVLCVVVYGILMMFGFAGIRVFGEPRYGVMDEPPVKRTGGRKRWE
jgi:hypothetical protein